MSQLLDHKKKIKHKIDLLLMSLEAIDPYALESTYQKNCLTISNKLRNIFKIRCGNYNRHPKYNTLCFFDENIKTISYIHCLIKDPYIQNITEIILNNYTNSFSCTLTEQYIKRFTYLYKKTQNYYNNLSGYTNINVSEKAIINLYIINIINKKTGIYNLIKYIDL